MRFGLGLIALGVSLVILANQASKPREHQSISATLPEAVSYRPITKQELGADVVEFFWYGCPHCLRLEHSLRNQAFHESISEVIVDGQYKASFIRVPAALNEEWTLDARLFYVLDGLGMDDAGHLEVMTIIGSERPKTRKDMVRLLNGQIVPVIESRQLLARVPEASQIDADMFSPDVDQKIQSSIDMGKSIGLTGVPVMVVGGNKVISLGSDATYETMGPSVISLLNHKQ